MFNVSKIKKLIKWPLFNRSMSRHETTVIVAHAVNFVSIEKPDRFRNINPVLVTLFLERRSIRRFKPSHTTRDSIFECAVERLKKLSDARPIFTNSDCSWVLLDALFVKKRTYRIMDILEDWYKLLAWILILFLIIRFSIIL